MKIDYDPEADAMYIQLKKGVFDHNGKIDENTIVDYDKKNNILGIEILWVKERNPNILFDLKRTLKEAEHLLA